MAVRRGVAEEAGERWPRIAAVLGKKSAVGGTNSAITNTVNTNDGQGNTANSSVTFTDKSTIGGKDHEDDNGEEDFSDVDGAPATDDESNTDHGNDFSQVSEDIGDQYNGTYGSFDPVTGLSTNTTVNGNDDTHETDTEADQGEDIHSESGTGTPVIADDVSFDDKVDEEGGSTDYEQVVATTQGTDLQGSTFRPAPSRPQTPAETNCSMHSGSRSSGCAMKLILPNGSTATHVLLALTLLQPLRLAAAPSSVAQMSRWKF
jgi:hypothetical protein